MFFIIVSVQKKRKTNMELSTKNLIWNHLEKHCDGQDWEEDNSCDEDSGQGQNQLGPAVFSLLKADP
jgi:hypothetical protein